MHVSDYYKIVIPHRYWTVEFKLHSAIMYGVCNVVGHPTLHHGKRRRPHVFACGFRLSKAMGIYAPTWPGQKPSFSIVGRVLEMKLYSHLPVDVIKYILKYL